MSRLPAAKLTLSLFSNNTCAVCGDSVDLVETEVPCWFTQASIAADLPPQIICDACVEKNDPLMFDQLLADRRRFWADDGPVPGAAS